ncbi:class I adenylate-forming enzyme family protein [Leucobacter albus]|uniref:Class I adenylate-forming enzyme family protein n=1 Tax=Leucobacter albus TaxID=272210 RepID=A0ABW3TK86_9MICO
MVTAVSFFDRGWKLNPHGVAYATADESWTFDEAGRMTNRLAHSLISLGVGRDVKVGVLSPNDPLAWLCVLATWRAGGIWVPLNPDHPVDETAGLLDRFDVDVLVYHPSLRALVDQLRTLPGAPATIVALGASAGDTNLRSWVQEFSELDPGVAVSAEDLAVIAPTGGTTGLPKGVMIAHRSVSVMVAHQMLALGYGPHDRQVNLAAAPMTHSAGFLSLQATARGGTTVIIPRATVDTVLDAIAAFGVTEMFLPPTVVYRLLDYLQATPRDLSTLRYLLYGAAPMSTEKLKQGIDQLGPIFLEVYGQTEAIAGVSFKTPAEHLDPDGSVTSSARLASCGRPGPLIEVTARNPETFEALPANESGEICVRGDIVMRGYYKNPEKTAETIVDGWLRTGDLGHLDDEGYLFITDRSKDLIISGGFNVYPGEVEQAIWSHPAVMDCAVIGVPHPDWGEQVTAIVELNAGHDATEEELRGFCRDLLGAVRTPKRLYFAKLPRSANGKVLKKDLRDAGVWLADAAGGAAAEAARAPVPGPAAPAA